ncbi:MAG TPA: tetratricopeptide repeat protein [Pyrinomonadaceae bacterium]
MKLFSRIALLLTLASVSYLFSLTNARAQTVDAPAASPKASPSPSQPGKASDQSKTSSTTPTPNASPQPQVTSPRERRQQAYTKLLEGQRYLNNMGPNPTPAAARLAEQSFQQAAELDPTLAEAHTALAEIAFFFSQDFDLAAREAALATNIDRNNFGAHRLLSRIYAIKSGLRFSQLDKAFVERAIAELREVVRLDSTDAEGWALLGEMYYATGRMSDAIDAWTRWAAVPAATDSRIFQFITNGRELAPDAAAARLGEAYMAAGRHTEAVAAIRRAISLSPDNKEYVELLGQALEKGGGDDNSIIAELQRMVTADPNSTSTLRLLAQVQARAGRIDDAAQTLRTAIARHPKEDREQLLLRLYLAQMFADALRQSDAIAVYEELLKSRGIGDAQLTSDDEKEFASEILQRIIVLQRSAASTSDVTATIERMRRLLGKDDPTADEQYIEFLRNQGQRREALEAIRAARQRFPDHDQFLQLEAETLTDLGHVDEGIALLRARLKRSVEDYGIYLTISNLYSQAGRGREAIEAARKAIALTPNDNPRMLSDALIVLSSAQERAGDTKGSEESLRSILAKDPTNATALNNLGYFLVERNERLTEALEMIQRAVKSEPTNSSFLDSLGWAYFKLGKFDEAERHLSDAARRDTSSATIQEHLGDLYLKLGKTEQAQVAWKKALSLSVEADEMARIKAKLSSNLTK